MHKTRDDKEIAAARMANILKTLREEAHRTQEAMAELLEITRPGYTYYEIGRTLPDVDTLYRLSQIYGNAFGEMLEEAFGPTEEEKEGRGAPDELSEKEQDLIHLIRGNRFRDPKKDAYYLALDIARDVMENSPRSLVEVPDTTEERQEALAEFSRKRAPQE